MKGLKDQKQELKDRITTRVNGSVFVRPNMIIQCLASILFLRLSRSGLGIRPVINVSRPHFLMFKLF